MTERAKNYTSKINESHSSYHYKHFDMNDNWNDKCKHFGLVVV